MARLKNLTERGHETQRQLRDVLVELILEKGYEQITVKNIVERAGIDRSTFYLHFKDKHELFTKSQEMLVDELVATIPIDGPMFSGVAVAFEHMSQNSKFYQVMLETNDSKYSQVLHDYVVRSVKPIVEQRIQQEAKAGLKIEADLVVNFLMGAFKSIARWWLQSDLPYTPAEMTQIFIQLALRGLISLQNPS